MDTCHCIRECQYVCTPIGNRSLWGMRNFIHVNLCASLFVAQLLFVVAVGMTEEPVSIVTFVSHIKLSHFGAL